MIISLYKVLKINKLHIRRKHKLDTSYFTPYIVSQGRWQYISANKTILISIKENSYLLHPSFSINNIMAMNLDGTERYMLMIEEQSLLALQLKSLEDLNKYLLLIANIDEQEEKVKEQKRIEEKLQEAAMKAWAANKKSILDSNKEYKRYKKKFGAYIAVCFLAPIVSLLFFMNSWDTEYAIIGVVIVSICFFFPLICSVTYDAKCSEISGKLQKIFIENYINNSRNK